MPAQTPRPSRCHARSVFTAAAAAVGSGLILIASLVSAPQAGSTVLASPQNPDAIIVGDSLTGGNVSYIGPTLRGAGLDVRLEALSARRIAVSFQFLGYRDSGVARVRSLKAAGVTPKLWVVQLGTNDLGAIKNCECADPVRFAGGIIDQLLDEIGPNVPIAWVTVLTRSSDRGEQDAARWFNHAINLRAATNPYLALIEWYGIGAPRPDWFLDNVHTNVAGVKVFTQMYIDRISVLLARPLGPRTQGSGPAFAERLGPPD